MAVRLTTVRHPYDLGDYLCEKSVGVLEQISKISEITTNKAKDFPEDVKEQLLDALYPALWNITKIVALASETEWSPADRDVIIEGGRDGLEDVLIRYGLGHMTGRWRKWQEFRFDAEDALQRIQRLAEALDLPDGEAQLQITHELREIKLEHGLVERMRELAESFRQGELDWQTYVASTLLPLSALSAELQDRLSDPMNFSPTLSNKTNR